MRTELVGFWPETATMNVIDEDAPALAQRGRVPLLRPEGGEQVRLFAPFRHHRDPEVIFDHVYEAHTPLWRRVTPDFIPSPPNT
jgi:hypothetical protein